MSALLKIKAAGVADIVALTVNTYETLRKQSDLSPRNPLINNCLNAYVGELLEAEQELTEKDTVLAHEKITSIRPRLLNLLSRAEYEMELYFARRFLMADALRLAGLDDFWYRDNYRALVKQELDGLQNLGLGDRLLGDARPIVFVGAGPLPLSVIDYHLQTGKKCVCVDIDADAIRLGRGLIERLGLTDVISFIHADGTTLDYKNYSLIMVAALVQGKDDVLRAIRATAPNALIGMRSAEGLMTLLYEKVDVEQICTCGFCYYGCALATAQTLNSTCFFGNCPDSFAHYCAVHAVDEAIIY